MINFFDITKEAYNNYKPVDILFDSEDLTLSVNFFRSGIQERHVEKGLHIMRVEYGSCDIILNNEIERVVDGTTSIIPKEHTLTTDRMCSTSNIILKRETTETGMVHFDTRQGHQSESHVLYESADLLVLFDFLRPRVTIRREHEDEIKIIRVEEGHLVLKKDSRHAHLYPGNMCIIPPHIFHMIYAETNVKMTSFFVRKR